jgi:hypothetical protein
VTLSGSFGRGLTAPLKEKKYSTSAAVDGSLKPILALDRLTPIDVPHT